MPDGREAAAPSAGQVDLWVTFADTVRDERLLARYRDILSPQELQREEQFYFAKDRHQYRVTRALVRTTLSRYLRVNPEDWRFAANEYGRPYVVSVDSAESPVHFNVSHTAGLIICAVADSAALGVDVEHRKREGAPTDVADHCFCASEAADLRRLSDEDRAARFYDYWTLKESYIKARGKGLSLPLDWFSFRFGDCDELAVSFKPELDDVPARWWFCLFDLSPMHVAAVCMARSSTGEQRLLAREVVPMEFERVLDNVSFRRCST